MNPEPRYMVYPAIYSAGFPEMLPEFTNRRPYWPSRPRIVKYSRKAWRKRRQGKGGVK